MEKRKGLKPYEGWPPVQTEEQEQGLEIRYERRPECKG